MQHVPYNYFVNLVQENNFHPVGTTMVDATNTTTILLVFTSDDQLKTIKYIHIRLVVCHTGCQFYELRSIPCFIQSIDDDLKRTMKKQAASGSSSKAHSFRMFIDNSGGLVAVPTDPPYCLVYPNIFSTTVPISTSPFQHPGWPFWATYLCLQLLHPVLACQPVRGPQVEIPWESPSDSPGSTVQLPAPQNHHPVQPQGAACRPPHGGTFPPGSGRRLSIGGQHFSQDANRTAFCTAVMTLPNFAE